MSHVVLNGIMQPLSGKIAVTQPFPNQFWIFLVQITTQESLLSHVVLNGITQPLRGKIAITKPFIDQFFILLVQINAQGSPFVPCGSKWNHATFHWGNSHTSAIS